MYTSTTCIRFPSLSGGANVEIDVNIPPLLHPPQFLVDVTENANQEVTGTAVNQTASATTLTFTRPLAPTDASKTALSSEVGERANILYAWGDSNTLAFHGSNNFGSLSLSDLSCTMELSAADADADEDCTSSDPAYDFAIAPSGNVDELELFWTVTGSSVAVKVCTTPCI